MVYIYIYIYICLYSSLGGQRAALLEEERRLGQDRRHWRSHSIVVVVSKAPKGNRIGATGSKNWVWF